MHEFIVFGARLLFLSVATKIDTKIDENGAAGEVIKEY